MRLLFNPACIAISVGLINFVSAHPGTNALKPRRTSSILINPNAQPNLPTLSEAVAAASAESLNLGNIQSDILIGMKNSKELFYFFSINNTAAFKAKLRSDILPMITTTLQMLEVVAQPITAVNIAFSQAGLTALGVTDNLGDSLFSAGQEADATTLGDPGTVNWVPGFLGRRIHGLLMLASDTDANILAQLANITSILGDSIEEIHNLTGSARPGTEAGHEHFGFMDGISQPALEGFVATPLPGQAVIPPGVILVNETSDPIPVRPAWAKDGSFLAFRQLKQLVPEFETFLANNPLDVPGLTPEQGSALLGARMVGRWKSGAPVDLAPLFDDPVLAADPQRNNNFTFAHPGEDILTNQTRCPFTAHIRKTAPRADFNPVNIQNHIIRSGIPYGPEVTAAEAAYNTTFIERGLAFVGYQSDIGHGFHFLQHSWADNVGFFFNKNDSTPGFDPIIGANNGQPRFVHGLDPTNFTRSITLVTDFIQSRGGEYFFSPSISAINDTITAPIAIVTPVST